MNKVWQEGISVITPTIRKSCIPQILSNFLRQQFKEKELIIIINKDDIRIEDFDIKKMNINNIRVYKVSEEQTLGECLNTAIKKAKYKYIAKFDDDDHYAQFYLTEMHHAFNTQECDVVCKQSIFYYLEEYNKLTRLAKIGQNKYVVRGAGATIGAKRSIFESIQFANRKSGTDTDFFLNCASRGLKCYSTSCYNYLCFRSKDARQHTWQITAEELESKCKGCLSMHIKYEDACKFIAVYEK